MQTYYSGTTRLNAQKSTITNYKYNLLLYHKEKSFTNKTYVQALYADFVKIFGKIIHNILVYNLQKYSIKV